jgi:mono/diheme cytochrome c family protein
MLTLLCRIALVGVVVSPVFSGCTESAIEARGFALPEGDADAGQATFVRLQCQQCHTVDGLSLPGEAGPGREVSVALGGDVTRIKTYGDLVTSIINPSHRIAYDPRQTLADDGVSRMRVYNDVMTVRELIDLVTFLQSHYDVVPPPQIYAPYYE